MNDLLSVTPKPHIDLPLLHVVLCIACFQSHQTAYRMLFLNGLHARLHNYRSTCFPMQGPLSVTSNTYRSIPEPRNELKRGCRWALIVYPLLYLLSYGCADSIASCSHWRVATTLTSIVLEVAVGLFALWRSYSSVSSPFHLPRRFLRP